MHIFLLNSHSIGICYEEELDIGKQLKLTRTMK